MPTYQPQTKIGYTTNYGNSFQYTEPSSTPKQLSYTADERMYGTTTNSYSPARSQVPRKAKGSGTSDDVMVTYETVYVSGFIYDKYRIIYTYPDGHIETEEVSKWFGMITIEQYAKEQAEKRAKEWAATHPSVPIGEPTTTLLLLMFAYLSYHEIKKRRQCKHFFLYFFP